MTEHQLGRSTTADDDPIHKGCVKCELTIDEEKSVDFWNFCPKCGKPLVQIKTSTNQKGVWLRL